MHRIGPRNSPLFLFEPSAATDRCPSGSVRFGNTGMTMKLDWQHPSVGIVAVVSGALLAGTLGLSSIKAAPADQPSSNAPANEHPPVSAAAPADTGTKDLPGPPSPFESRPAAADQGTPAVTGR